MGDARIRDASRGRGLSEDWRRKANRSETAARWLFVGALLTLVASVAIAAWSSTRIREGIALVERSNRLSMSLDAIVARLVDAETGQRGFLLTGDNQFLEPYYGGLSRLEEAIDEARRQLIDPQRIQRFDALAAAAHEAAAYLRQTVDAGINGGREETLAMVRSGSGKARMDEVRRLAGGMQDEAASLLEERTATLERRAAMAFVAMLGIHAALLGLLGGAFMSHRRGLLIRRRLEDRQSLMVRELNHRVRNNLAAMLAIAEHTMRASEASTAPAESPSQALERFLDAFTGRVRAMGVVHTMLSDRRWDDVDLRELVERILAPYLPGEKEEVRISGPAVKAPARTAGPIGATLHELATNAVRHGALAPQSGGELRVRWSVEPSESGTALLRLEWKEHHRVRPVQEPNRHGLGTELIRNLTVFELGGKAQLQFEPDGVRCVLEAPLTP